MSLQRASVVFLLLLLSLVVAVVLSHRHADQHHDDENAQHDISSQHHHHKQHANKKEKWRHHNEKERKTFHLRILLHPALKETMAIEQTCEVLIAEYDQVHRGLDYRRQVLVSRFDVFLFSLLLRK